TLNAALLYRYLYQAKVYAPQPGWSRYMVRLLLANGAMVGILWLFVPQLIEWFDMRHLYRALHLSGWITLAMVVYVGCLWTSGIRLRDFTIQVMGES
ncbi:MAG: hypothetical protein KDH94_05665, partial [Coxiellaceae bacterium]|nr:hypothetical protein [Coxiellaceae bacterium]